MLCDPTLSQIGGVCWFTVFWERANQKIRMQQIVMHNCAKGLINPAAPPHSHSWASSQRWQSKSTWRLLSISNIAIDDTVCWNWSFGDTAQQYHWLCTRSSATEVCSICQLCRRRRHLISPHSCNLEGWKSVMVTEDNRGYKHLPP